MPALHAAPSEGGGRAPDALRLLDAFVVCPTLSLLLLPAPRPADKQQRGTKELDGATSGGGGAAVLALFLSPHGRLNGRHGQHACSVSAGRCTPSPGALTCAPSGGTGFCCPLAAVVRTAYALSLGAVCHPQVFGCGGQQRPIVCTLVFSVSLKQRLSDFRSNVTMRLHARAPTRASVKMNQVPVTL